MKKPTIERLDTWIDGKSTGLQPYLHGERLPETRQCNDNGTLWCEDEVKQKPPRNQINVVNNGGTVIIKNR